MPIYTHLMVNEVTSIIQSLSLLTLSLTDLGVEGDFVGQPLMGLCYATGHRRMNESKTATSLDYINNSLIFY
jgi:hypothetical protein